MDRLAGNFRVLAPDLCGQGRNTGLGADGDALEEDVGLIEEVAAGVPVHVVGHSYGGAVALRYSMRHPGRVRSLTLYEPAAWHLLAAGFDGDRAGHEVLDVGSAVMHLVDAGRPLEAARHFVDYWNGDGSWDRMGALQKDRVAEQMPRVVAHFVALFSDPAPLAAYAALRMPVLLLSGRAGPRSGQRVTELLAAAMPRATLQRFDALGHMGPVTSADEVNDVIARFIRITSCVGCFPVPRVGSLATA
jgi:pimeloyl-ACP methyl ester carboxylesterase